MEELLKELFTEIKKLNSKHNFKSSKNDFEPVDKTRFVSDDVKERTMRDVFMDYMASQNPQRVIEAMGSALDKFEDDEGIEEEMELSDIDPTFIKEVENITADYKAGKIKKKEKPVNINNNFVLEKKENDSEKESESDVKQN